MPAANNFDLDRFVAAQAGGVYEGAVREMRAGHKRSHWMWFVFPQLQGLGYSATARRFGISGLAEAQAYLAHPVLGARLCECAEVLAALDPRIAATDVFGTVDTLKLCSSLTLFERAAGAGSIFARLLDRFFAGRRDARTLEML